MKPQSAHCMVTLLLAFFTMKALNSDLYTEGISHIFIICLLPHHLQCVLLVQITSFQQLLSIKTCDTKAAVSLPLFKLIIKAPAQSRLLVGVLCSDPVGKRNGATLLI